MLAQLFHAEEACGTATVGSSEAILLGGLAMKRRWQARARAGPSSSGVSCMWVLILKPSNPKAWPLCWRPSLAWRWQACYQAAGGAWRSSNPVPAGGLAWHGAGRHATRQQVVFGVAATQSLLAA